MKTILEKNKEAVDVNQRELGILIEKYNKITRLFWIFAAISTLSVISITIGYIISNFTLVIVSLIFLTLSYISFTFLNNKASKIFKKIFEYQAKIVGNAFAGILKFENDPKDSSNEPPTK